MKLARALFALHLAALAFAVGGIVVALPHPALWSSSPLGATVFKFGMGGGGVLYLLLGAATMLTFGLATLGPRRTLLFFAVATLLPLAAELLGTGTGWPFGAYSYTDGLGLKVAGRVPFTVPLSWFYMGFASYLLAARLSRRWQRSWLGARRRGARRRADSDSRRLRRRASPPRLRRDGAAESGAARRPASRRE